MKPRTLFCTVFFMLLSVAGAFVEARADDSAASFAAGGLRARQEIRIVMAKEVLRIGLSEVVVDYDFRNDTDEDVTTEVAFPEPPFGPSVAAGDPAKADFSDFKLEINGKPAAYQIEAKAFMNGTDVSDILTKYKLGIDEFCKKFDTLPESERKRLMALHVVDGMDEADCWLNWANHLQYHWTQTFPAHSTTHIRHEYAPQSGFSPDRYLKALRAALTPALARTSPKLWKASGAQEIAGFCLAPDQIRGLIHKIRTNKSPNVNYGDFGAKWVDFILTTANTWKKPIEDFTLIVDSAPKSEIDDGPTFMGLCLPQNAKLEKLDDQHMQVHLTNFVPTAELHIGYFDIN